MELHSFLFFFLYLCIKHFYLPTMYKPLKREPNGNKDKLSIIFGLAFNLEVKNRHY